MCEQVPGTEFGGSPAEDGPPAREDPWWKDGCDVVMCVRGNMATRSLLLPALKGGVQIPSPWIWTPSSYSSGSSPCLFE